MQLGEKSDKIVGLTFGAFDLFHLGHLTLLYNARQRCDKLIVCVSSDDYIRKIKNKEPVFPLADRLMIVQANRYVDDIDVQGLNKNNTKKALIKKYKPNVLFVGDDWNKKTYTGESLGVKVEYLPHTKGISTTKIVKMIKKLPY